VCPCIGRVSLPLIIYTRLLALWYLACQSGFSAIESHFRLHRPGPVALDWHRTRGFVGASVLKIQ